MVTIIDFKAGNIASIQNMLKKLGAESIITSDPKEILLAGKLILPGVGAFDFGMQQLNQANLIDAIKSRAGEGIPLLGICLGAQMLGKNSEEGNLPGLGLMDMSVIKFQHHLMPKDSKIPHMGWKEVTLQKESQLFDGMYTDPRFYFVHSYHFKTENSSVDLCKSNYGYDFVSAVQQNNISGVQFHPEKSHKYGMKLLENFVKS